MKENVCGTSEITGARFSLYPMSDRFVDIILSALKEVDTKKVWMETDDVSTCVRGRSEHVFDVVKAIFLTSAAGGEHVVLNATFSNGCPGDTAGDTYMAEDSLRINERLSNSIKQEVAVQFALYPLGIPGYMDVIMDQVKTVDQQGVFSGGVHYASRLDGDGNKVFSALENAFEGARNSDSTHIVMTVTMSANSPSRKAGQ
ncbi:YkoF family thiamine/hydroxymethylpyrimidine-binding protein [Mesobacillus subterraneus]|uniref:Thiamine-binding protein n=1 Tax=Mesobacillus subterraneus TaxID=285983 RepID=A0A427TP35_9BACI|nr:YkoF family thiamine/hydroxymethylpyrimidine-binding protein [Mesobacillus subterraneus]RSD26140.1 thiamine-binding protein [Mesobacillus subterraneus]